MRRKPLSRQPQASFEDEYRQSLGAKSKDELILLLLAERSEKIPISLFLNPLGPLEVVVKYLKENKNYTIKQISGRMCRSSKTIWSTYDHVKHRKITVPYSEYQVPLSIYCQEKLSVLESTVYYLKTNTGLTYHQIAQLIGRDDRTIWTVYRRAEEKQHTR